MTIIDLYRQLFGKGGLKDGDVISMAEHGRSGGVSTGQGFKFTVNVPYALQLDRDGAGNPIYIGMANTGTDVTAASWQIRKLTFDGANNVTSIKYADGSPNFNYVWNDRTTLNYS